ncbi:MAG: TRAP transporter large permease [Alphaproteobacteria bacterium]|nr:TRAP transporter large permease [Alphaproteobacteria bacterium]
MDLTTLAALGFGVLLLLLYIRVPVGLAMMVVGTVGIFLIRPPAALPKLASEIFNEATYVPLTIIPLFVLMGNLAGVAGLSRDLYAAAHNWLSSFKGGLASAAVVGCAGFSALSGSSLASAMTMGRVSLPEMKRYGYHDGLATGAIAAGGTLGILIPPSAGFVVYAILTEESIGRLFMAGVVPGLMLTLFFIVAIWIVVTLDPSKAPTVSADVSRAEKWRSLGRASVMIGIIVVTVGGIYGGVFSATEAAGIGAALTLLATIVRKKLNWDTVREVFQSTLRATGSVYLILFGAFVFKTFVGFTAVTFALSAWIEAQGFTGFQVVCVFLVVLIIMGMFLDGFAMLVLAVPVIHPILEPLGFDLVLFGVLAVIALEMGLISPPVGVNVFIVKGIAREVPMATIFRGIWPFWFAMLAAIIVLLLVPNIALFLPNSMFG